MNYSNSFRLLSCIMFHPPIFKHGQIHLNLRINFGIHHKVLHELFIHHDVLNLFFIHHDLLVTFPSFPTFLIHQNLRIKFQNFPLESAETCQILNQFNSLEISGIFSPIPLQHFSVVTTLSPILLEDCIQRRNLSAVIDMT